MKKNILYIIFFMVLVACKREKLFSNWKDIAGKYFGIGLLG